MAQNTPAWNQPQWPQQAPPRQQVSPWQASPNLANSLNGMTMPNSRPNTFNQPMTPVPQQMPQLPTVSRNTAPVNQQQLLNNARQGQQAIASTGDDQLTLNNSGATQQAGASAMPSLPQDLSQGMPPELAAMMQDPQMQKMMQDPAVQQMAAQMMQGGGLEALMGGQGMPGMTGANGEPMESMLPDPASLATGMAIGVPTALGLTAVAQPERIGKAAGFLNGLPFMDKVNKFFDELINTKLLKNTEFGKKHATRIKAALTTLAPKDLEKLMLDDIIEATEKKYKRIFDKNPLLRSQLKRETTLKGLSAKLNDAGFIDDLVKANKGLGKEAYHSGGLRKLFGKGANEKKLFGGVRNFAKGQQHVLERYGKRFGVINPEFAAKGAAGIEGLSLGRSFKSMFSHLEGIFSGDALKESGFGRKLLGVGDEVAKAGGSGGLKAMLPKLLGPAMMGAFVFGFPMMQAKKAEEGQKTKTFFHGLLGEQLGLFMGWEVARGVLRGSGLVGKALKGLGMTRFLVKGSVAGFAVEMAAMFVLSKPFQKVGEKISHMIFGKPKAHDEAAKKKAPNLPLTLDPSQVALSRDEQVFKPFNDQYHKQLHINERPNQPSVSADQISQSFARQEHEETANAVISDINSRWPDDSQIIPVEIASGGSTYHGA